MAASNNDTVENTATTVPSTRASKSQQPERQLDHHHNRLNSNTSTSASTSSCVPNNIMWDLHHAHHQPLELEEESGPKSSLVGNELSCKRRFSTMVQATYRIQIKSNVATTMQVIFEGDYVHMIRLTLPDGQVSDYPFTGNSQYIPPEMYLHASYSRGLSDVWVLGISLYQMLVGSYPFKAKDDRKLVKKMLHADFGIPDHFSEDVKDLLRRMLAPEQSRASLDLVMFHPWLKPYRIVPSSTSPSLSSLAVSAPRISLRINRKGRKSKWRCLINKTCRFLFLGPYPPPSRPYRELAHLGR